MQSFVSDQVVHQIPGLVLQIIDVQPHAKATVATSGHEGEEDSEGMPVEALLGMDMAHPQCGADLQTHLPAYQCKP